MKARKYVPPRHPPKRLGRPALRALAAVLSGRRMVHKVAEFMGRTNTAAVEALLRLRDAGMVAWEFGRHGTLRPTCRFVPAEEV